MSDEEHDRQDPEEQKWPPPAWGAGWASPPPPPPRGGGPQAGPWGSYGGWHHGGYGQDPYAQGLGWGPYGAPPGWGPLQPRRRRPRWAGAVLVAVLALAAAAVGVGVGHSVWSPASSAGQSAVPPFVAPSPSGGSNTANPEGNGGPSDVSSIAAKIDPALVDVAGNFSYQQAKGYGTGIVLTSNGLVLTNNHVIDGATSLSATDVGNGRTYAVRVLGYDPHRDVALLKLEGASGLKVASIGNSSDARVGEPVVAAGNAGGLGGTPTSVGGSITALDQSITAQDELDGSSEHLTGLIETDAPIQPGDSGGALVNTSGQVIGMNTAASQGFSFQSGGNQGFSIPINEALAIARQIEAGKGSASVHVGPSAFLGVLLYTTGHSGFGPGGFGQSVSGAEIEEAIPGDAAAQAGLQGGDVITSFNGKQVTSDTNLSEDMIPEHPGDKVQIGFLTPSGQSETTTVTLGSGPPA